MLESIQKGRLQHPPRVLIYGTEGIGKSTFAAQSTAPVFVQTEDGCDGIDVDKFPLAVDFNDVAKALTALAQEEHQYQTVVVDSLDWLERDIWASVCQRFGVSNIEKADGGYARGYTHALDEWKTFVNLLSRLRSRGMAVVLIAHSKIEKFEDPENASYDRYAPRLHKHAKALLCEWVDVVGFATRKMRTQSEDAGFGRKRNIAAGLGKGGGDRVLRLVGGPACEAKNRYGMPDEIPLDWKAFVDCFPKN